jgi:hypothetical protein
MADKSIIFSAEEVREALESHVVCIRRALGAPISIAPWEPGVTAYKDGEFGVYREGKPVGKWGLEFVIRPPCGKPGDRLWVKEKYALSIFDPESLEPDPENPDDWSSVHYEVDGDSGRWEEQTVLDGELHSKPILAPWQNAGTMPRWASRLNVVNIDVSIERVNTKWFWTIQLEVENG